MPKKLSHPKLPNGFGSIKKLSGTNRVNPFGVYPPTKEFDDEGRPVAQPAICYVDDWFKGFTVLNWYHNGEYYKGRERELSSKNDKLQDQIQGILTKFNQTQREKSVSKTFEEVFKEYYKKKFEVEYKHKGKKSSMERSMSAAFGNCSALHEESFWHLTDEDLQKVVDECPKKHASLELIITLYHQMYEYADSKNLCQKDYSQFVHIKTDDDDESGVPFTDEEMQILWEHKDDETIEMILINCYSGFRISEFIDLETDLDEMSFFGGSKTDAGKSRYVPIYSGIQVLVKNRLNSRGNYIESAEDFRKEMYEKLTRLGISHADTGEKHTPHDCRHTFTSICDHYKVNENDKKEMLGHKFQDVTNRVYRHRRLEDLREQIEKIKLEYSLRKCEQK